MSDYGRFKRGGKTYPLATGTGHSALRDADPFVFYALEFFAKVIETHVGARLMEAAAQTTAITAPVVMTVPFDPFPQLLSAHFKFPLLAVYRLGGKLEPATGGQRRDESKFELLYILPPLTAAKAEQVAPLLIAVRDVIDDRADLGKDPTYTPTGGTVADTVWVAYAGAERVQMSEYEVGALDGPGKDLFFYALRMEGLVREKADIASDTFEDLAGTDAAVDLTDPSQKTVIVDFVQTKTYDEPTLTVATPNTGSKAGGTTVVLTGTNFRVGSTPTVTFGNVPATAVTVLSATSVQCVTPAHDAFPTFIADVVLTDVDALSATLVAGFTFTTP
jgi:hypothetical protein